VKLVNLILYNVNMVDYMLCPEPKILGDLITTIVHAQGEDKYFWYSNIHSIIIAKHDGSYILLRNSNIYSTLRTIYSSYGHDVVINDFKLFEHNVDVTRGNDDARFEECNWSDYSYDGLKVWLRISVIASMDPQV